MDHATPSPGRPPPVDDAPTTVVWDVTRAGGRRARRAPAAGGGPGGPPELDVAEGLDLVDQVADLGAQEIVVTGGDPLARLDVYVLLARAADRGLRVVLAAAPGRPLNEATLRCLREAGVAELRVAVDGADLTCPFALAGEPGALASLVEAQAATHEVDLALRVVTTAARDQLPALWRMPELLAGLVSAWTVAFLPSEGPAPTAERLDAHEQELALAWLALAAERQPLEVTTVAAPSYHRVRVELGLAPPPAQGNDGKGQCFVSATGEVRPSAELPLRVGDVRDRPLAELYRRAPLMRALRDPDRLGGKCGRCEHRRACGGSRARAYAATGDPLAEDPACPYWPAAAASA